MHVHIFLQNFVLRATNIILHSPWYILQFFLVYSYNVTMEYRAYGMYTCFQSHPFKKPISVHIAVFRSPKFHLHEISIHFHSVHVMFTANHCLEVVYD